MKKSKNPSYITMNEDIISVRNHYWSVEWEYLYFNPSGQSVIDLKSRYNV